MLGAGPGRNAAAIDTARDEPVRRQPGIRFEGVTVAYGHTVALDHLDLIKRSMPAEGEWLVSL